MNRRDFQRNVLAAITVVALTRQAVADVSVEAKTNVVFRYRLRYMRQGRQLRFWARVSNRTNLDSDVPVRLILSSDISGLNVLSNSVHLSRVIQSHIIRPAIVLPHSSSWVPGGPLYATLRVGYDETSTKTWLLQQRVS